MSIKILLLGEFSGFFLNLAAGLRELGHEVTIAAGYDGFKDIAPDVPLEFRSYKRLARIGTFVLPLVHLSKFKNFDVVQVIHPFTPNVRFFPNIEYFRILKRYNKKLFLSAAGSDPVYWQLGRSRLRYGPFDDYLRYDIKKARHKFQTKKLLQKNYDIAKLFDGIIPVMFDYHVGYRDFKNCRNIIPLPIDSGRITYGPLDFKKGPLNIFHGVTRYGFKGTKFIEEAFEIFGNRYPNDVKLSIQGRLPLDKYLRVMRKQHVVLDQTNSHSMGMNALASLALGKITMSGSEEVANEANYGTSSPAINLNPSKWDVLQKLEELLDNRSNLHELSLRGREFITTHHDSKLIAQKYVNSWFLDDFS